MPRSIPMNLNLNLASLRLGASLLFLAAPCIAAEDILIADFEGDSYGDGKVTGEAFANRPAQANVNPRNKVTGHLGKGLVNTFRKGDSTTGTLTSPPFTIERKHINFLIGAGNHPPFPRPPVRPNGCFRSLPLKAIS